MIKGEPLGGGVVVDIKWSGGWIEVGVGRWLLAWELSQFSQFSHVGAFLPGYSYSVLLYTLHTRGSSQSLFTIRAYLSIAILGLSMVILVVGHILGYLAYHIIPYQERRRGQMASMALFYSNIYLLSP